MCKIEYSKLALAETKKDETREEVSEWPGRAKIRGLPLISLSLSLSLLISFCDFLAFRAQLSFNPFRDRSPSFWTKYHKFIFLNFYYWDLGFLVHEKFRSEIFGLWSLSDPLSFRCDFEFSALRDKPDLIRISSASSSSLRIANTETKQHYAPYWSF